MTPDLIHTRVRAGPLPGGLAQRGANAGPTVRAAAGVG